MIVSVVRLYGIDEVISGNELAWMDGWIGLMDGMDWIGLGWMDGRTDGLIFIGFEPLQSQCI